MSRCMWVHVSWVDQECAVIQKAPATQALILPLGALPDGDHRLEMSIARPWFDTLDAIGPGNAYLDDSTIEFTFPG
ncbi:hypothetical protein H5399_09225 [Tessaracoccus sp. MC1627]|uniref:hypothetical protein n=1 Tax=Tessaracoccus sp. MC1627 TaxID=2760312 RepID=UPI001600BC3F|nr:hypothetical protein [Tessaracoccus sp. MC1627]MBB1512782.1 hypothetical protein [Tessaracoccus sp. MC1627]